MLMEGFVNSQTQGIDAAAMSVVFGLLMLAAIALLAIHFWSKSQ